VAKFAQGKNYSETTLLKDLNPNPDAIKKAFRAVQGLNYPDNIRMLTVGLDNTVAELRKQYYDLREKDWLEADI
jgi:hypothetical protein